MHTLNPTQKTILSLLADGDFHSGTELADTIGISRTGVWKQLKFMDELGLTLNAVSGKGYRLDRSLELLDGESIIAALDKSAKCLATSLEIFDQIPSTNTYLLDRASDGTASGSICLAERQTAGKGRRGRSWISPFGSNIYLSLLWRYQSSPLMLSGLSLAIGVAVMRALNSFFPDLFQLKWPNDIFYLGSKLGGILVEMSGESGGPCTVVVGLGLNIFLDPADAVTIDRAWTDLSRITGSYGIGRNNLIAGLLNHLLPVLAEFEGSGISYYVEEWRKYDYLKGRQATLYIGDKAYSGMVRGINDQGLLLLDLPDGRCQAFASGEVSLSRDLP